MDWTFCKYCKCRATNCKGFWTKHTTANHIFPRNTTSEARTSYNVPDEIADETPNETPSASLTAVKDDDEETISDSLAWEGIYMCPIIDDDAGAVMTAVIEEFNDEAPSPPTLRIRGGERSSESTNDDVENNYNDVNEEATREDDGIDQATRDRVEATIDRMGEVFPGHYSMYRADRMSQYVDFARWMMWNQDAIPYSDMHWTVFPLSIRMRLVREGHLAYNLPLFHDDDKDIIDEANRNPMSVNGILSGGGSFNGILLEDDEWQSMLTYALALEVFPNNLPGRDHPHHVSNMDRLVCPDVIAPLGADSVDSYGWITSTPPMGRCNVCNCVGIAGNACICGLPLSL